jgi:bacillithiol biosynthesis cysteine-adding enzyme BshC
MDCRALAFRQLPHQPKIFLDYLDHFERVRKFYEHPPSVKLLPRIAKKLDYPVERRKEVAAILGKQNVQFGASARTLENLDRFEKGALAVVSGQQVGLFSGPAYAIYKALSAVEIARELTSAGVGAVPIFWMATEDHDLDEVRHSTWFQDGKLQRFELPSGTSSALPVGRVKLGPEAEKAAGDAADLLSNQGSEFLAQMLRESYRANETYGTAFAKLFARLFAEQGLLLMDPLDPGLHQIAGPIYRQAIENRDALTEKLLERGKELEKAGYAAQVKVTSKSTLLFYMGAGARQAGDAGGPREVVSASGGKFHAGTREWTREEFLELAEREPENFSPNALFRPVVQDYLLPTAAYIAGPAEIAYFAQSEVLYQEMLGRMTVMLPRTGFTLVDAKAAKLLKRYELTVEQVWRGPQAVRARLECKSVPKKLALEFQNNQKHIKKMLGKLGAQISKLDPTLEGSVETARKKIDYQLEKLRRKTGRAQDEKDGLLRGHEQYLESLLNPHKVLQSRELCFLPFLARLGSGGLGELQKLATGKKLGKHFICRLP